MEPQCLFALVFAIFCTSCADEMPIVARYAPASCPEPSPFAGALWRPPPEGQEAPDAPSAAPPPNDPRLDLNRASAAQLDELPGVGPALAARILAYRERRPFRKPSDLMRVRGIGPATFAKLADRVVVAD